MDLEKDFSWIVWVNFVEATVGADSYVDLIGQGDCALSGQSMSIMRDTDDSRSIQILGPSGDLTKTDIGVAEGWNSIAYSKSTGSKKIYLNSKLVAGYTVVSGASFEPTDDNGDVEIGRINNGAFKYRGASKKFGPILVYQKELSQSEVQQAHGAIHSRVRAVQAPTVALLTTKIVFSLGSPVIAIDNVSTPTTADINFSNGLPTVTLDAN